ncbi:MAG: acyltransferase [Xanthomonadales bacterium]
MFNKAGQIARGASILLLMGVSTLVLTASIFVLSMGKFLTPRGVVRNFVRGVLAGIAELWISINNLLLSLYCRTRWDVEIPRELDRKGCYLVNSNHQSWVDILVLQRCFNRRLPFLRFFLKSQLIRVPFLGVAWWALDFPFMKRVSKAQLASQPGLKGRDLESARKACEKFTDIPVAMMNFPEGTRFSVAKRDAGNSPYKNLLLPRIGGVGQVLFALGDQLDALIDVTIVYPGDGQPGTAPTFWQLVSGQLPEIIVRAQQREIPAHLLGRNFRMDPEFRHDLESWSSSLWLEKDQLISSIHKAHQATNRQRS